MSFCFCTDQKDVPKNVNEVDQEHGVGELSLSACSGVGNRPPRKKRIANPAPGSVSQLGIGNEQRIQPCQTPFHNQKILIEYNRLSHNILNGMLEIIP